MSSIFKIFTREAFWSHFFHIVIYKDPKEYKNKKQQQHLNWLNILRDNQPQTIPGPKSPLIFLFRYWRCHRNFNILSLQERFSYQSYLVLIASSSREGSVEFMPMHSHTWAFAACIKLERNREIRHLLQFKATKAQSSLCQSTVSPVISLLASDENKYGNLLFLEF